MKDSHGRPTIEIERLWHFITLDPIEEQRNRDDQLAFCGRQGHQPLEMFDNWSVIRFNHIYQAFIRQLHEEAKAAERARQEMAMRGPH